MSDEAASGDGSVQAPPLRPLAPRRERTTGVADFLILLSGASPRILRRCPTERPKYTGIGSTILLNAAIAAMSATFALHLDAGLTLAWAVFLGIVLGATLIALDRWLIASLDRQSNPWRYLILAVPRLGISILLGIAITTPLLLQLFSSDIYDALTVIQQRQIQAFYSSLPSSALGQQLKEQHATVATYEEIIATNGGAPVNPYHDPVVVALQQQRNDAFALESTYYKTWQCQLYGTYGGQPCPPGNGPLAKASQNSYLSAKAQVTDLDNQIQARITQVNSNSAASAKSRLDQARQALPEAQAKLKELQSSQDVISNEFLSSERSNNGLIPRLQALSEVIQSSPVVSSVRWLFYALFVLLQSLPIGVRVLLNLGPENTYEKMRAYEEQTVLRAAREDIARRQAIRSLE